MSFFNFNFHDFSVAFLSVLLEGIPFLLLGALISGLVDVFVSAERVTKILPKQPGAAIFVGGLLGLIFPMCECGSVVVIRRFLKKGLPLSCATAYMLGAPIVSPIVALSTWQAFSQSTQPEPIVMVSLRLGIGYLIAVGVGFLVHILPKARILQPGVLATQLNPLRRRGLSIAAEPAAREMREMEAAGARRGGLSVAEAPSEQDFSEVLAGSGLRRKLLLSVQSATADFLDVAFFFIIGAAITCVFNTGIRQEVLTPLAASPLLGITSLMVLASLLALCSTTDAFVAWTFTAFSPAAKLAFLLFGPVFDLKLFWLYGLIFQKRFVIVLGIGLFIVIALLCWRLEALQIFSAGPRMIPQL